MADQRFRTVVIWHFRHNCVNSLLPYSPYACALDWGEIVTGVAAKILCFQEAVLEMAYAGPSTVAGVETNTAVYFLLWLHF